MGLTPTQRNFRMQMAQFDKDKEDKLRKDKPPKLIIFLVVLFLILSIGYYSGIHDDMIKSLDQASVKDFVSDKLGFINNNSIKIISREKESVYNFYAHYTKLFNSITMFSNDMLKELDSIASEDLEIVIDRLEGAYEYYTNNKVPDFLVATNEMSINQISASLNYMNGILAYKISNSINDYNKLSELSKLYNYWNSLRRDQMISNFDKYGIEYEINDINIRFWLKKINP